MVLAREDAGAEKIFRSNGVELLQRLLDTGEADLMLAALRTLVGICSEHQSRVGGAAGLATATVRARTTLPRSTLYSQKNGRWNTRGHVMRGKIKMVPPKPIMIWDELGLVKSEGSPWTPMEPVLSWSQLRDALFGLTHCAIKARSCKERGPYRSPTIKLTFPLQECPPANDVVSDVTQNICTQTGTR